MAVGDIAAAEGLQVFPSTQDIRDGYKNDNQRGDDVGRVMRRAATLEKQVRQFNSVYTAATTGASKQTNAGGEGWLTGQVTIPAVNYARNVKLSWCAYVTDKAAGAAVEVQLRDGTATVLKSGRVNQEGNSISGEFTFRLPANAAGAYRLAATKDDGHWSVSGDDVFTWLQATVVELPGLAS